MRWSRRARCGHSHRQRRRSGEVELAPIGALMPADECAGMRRGKHAHRRWRATLVRSARSPRHAPALLPRPELNGHDSPCPAPSCAPVAVPVAGLAAPSSDESCSQLLPPTHLASAPVAVPFAAPGVAPPASLAESAARILLRMAQPDPRYRRRRHTAAEMQNPSRCGPAAAPRKLIPRPSSARLATRRRTLLLSRSAHRAPLHRLPICCRSTTCSRTIGVLGAMMCCGDHARVRTTVMIDDDVLAVARALAQREGSSLGSALSSTRPPRLPARANRRYGRRAHIPRCSRVLPHNQ